MTVIFPLGRALSQHFLPRSHHVLTRLSASTSLRLSCTAQKERDSSSLRHSTATNRAYSVSAGTHATATTAKSAGRPKAHTGKTAATKAATKTATKSKRTKAKVTKSKKKRPVKKTKAKAGVKARPKRKVASATAIKKKAVDQRKTLKSSALLTEPKKLPDNSWTVYFVENKVAKSTPVAENQQHTKDLAASYKTLSPLERERLNHTANENKATNEKNYKQWLSQFTPLQIKTANAARKALASQKKATTKSGKAVAVHLIKDTRLVKLPRNAYNLYNSERFSSGDFKHMALKEAVGLIGAEWKAMSSSQQQPYKDQAQNDQNRYAEEYKSVYGRDAGSVTKKPKST